MKYLKQFALILLISCAGELLHALIPLNIPASVYGIVLLFTLLMTGIMKVDMIRETSSFLITIMPVMFVPAAVGLMKDWGMLQSSLPAYLIIIAVTTVVVMASAGRMTQLIMKLREGKQHE